MHHFPKNLRYILKHNKLHRIGKSNVTFLQLIRMASSWLDSRCTIVQFKEIQMQYFTNYCPHILHIITSSVTYDMIAFNHQQNISIHITSIPEIIAHLCTKSNHSKAFFIPLLPLIAYFIPHNFTHHSWCNVREQY